MTSPVQEIAFFSYSREDSDFALRLAKDLKDAGAAVWIDQLDIEPGQDWDIAVEAAVTRCPRMLLVLSPVSVQSRNVRNEIAFALDEMKSIIPVLYQDCMVPLQLRRVQHIDFRTDYEHGLKTLLKVLGAQQAIGASVPAVPGTPKEAHPAPTDTGVRRLIAEQVELELQRRQAAEQARLDAEKKLAAERAALEEERRQLAATKEKLDKQEQERPAAEQVRLEEERRQATERAIEEERQRTAAQERLEQQGKQAAEQAWLEERRRQAVEQARLEEERRQAAEQARLEEERKRAAAEKARLEQEERERLAAAEKSRLGQQERERQQHEQKPPAGVGGFSGPASNWGKAVLVGVMWALWYALIRRGALSPWLFTAVRGCGYGLAIGICLGWIRPRTRWPYLAGLVVSWALAAELGFFVGVPLRSDLLNQVTTGVIAGTLTVVLLRRAHTPLSLRQALTIVVGYIIAGVAAVPLNTLHLTPLAILVKGIIGTGVMFWQLSKVKGKGVPSTG